MYSSILLLLFAGSVPSFLFSPSKPHHHNQVAVVDIGAISMYHKSQPVLLFKDTSNPAYVGINTVFPVRPLHVVGSSLFENTGDDSSYAIISLRKSYSGNFNIGPGKIIGALSFQEGSASIAALTTPGAGDGNRNVDITFNTTNSAGTFGERFRITEEGVLNYAADMSQFYTDRSVVDKSYVDARTGSTLDGAMALGNSTARSMIFEHVAEPIIRKLIPNNVDSLYQYDGNEYSAQSFSETIQRFDGVNSSGRPNYVWMFGYNQNGGGGRINANDASMHISMETHYESGGPLMELHIPQVQSKTGITQRLLSFTVNKSTGAAFTYFTAGSMEFRSPATSIGGVSPHYASFSPAGIDIQNPDPSATTALRLYSNNGSGSLTMQSGTGQSVISTNGSTADLTIQTSRFLNLSNQIQFNDVANEYNNGNVTFDLPSQDENKAFIFRDLGQHPIIEFRDIGAGNHQTTVYGKLKITGEEGVNERLLTAALDGSINTLAEGADGDVLKLVAGKPAWMPSATGWDSIMEYSFTTSDTNPVQLESIPIAHMEAITIVIDFIAIQSGGAAYTGKRSVLAVRNNGITIGSPQDIVPGNSISGNWVGIQYGVEPSAFNSVVVRIQSPTAADTNYKAVIKFRKVQVY
jgi:hypothetical protein